MRGDGPSEQTVDEGSRVDGNSDAWWYRRGKRIKVTGEHYQALLDNPTKYGLKADTKDAGPAMDEAIDKGWVRVRVHHMTKGHVVNVSARNKAQARKAIDDALTTWPNMAGGSVTRPGIYRELLDADAVNAFADRGIFEMSDTTGAHTQVGDVIHYVTAKGEKRKARVTKVLKNGAAIKDGEVIPFDAITYVGFTRTETTHAESPLADQRDRDSIDPDADVPMASRATTGDPTSVEAPTPDDDEEVEPEDTSGPKDKEELIGFNLRDMQTFFDLQQIKGLSPALALQAVKDKFHVKQLKVGPTGKLIPVEGLPRGAKIKPPPLPPEDEELPPEEPDDDGGEEAPPEEA